MTTVNVVAYRGEHGKQNAEPFQSRMGSLSFGSFSTARKYGLFPNNRWERPVEPRIIKAKIQLLNPLVVQEDPFLDLPVLIDALGIEKAARIASDLSDWIVDNACFEPYSNYYADVDELIQAKPSTLKELYLQAYPIFDNHLYASWILQAGYDGAAYWGAGENAAEMEYRTLTDKAATVLEVIPIGGFIPKTKSA